MGRDQAAYASEAQRAEHHAYSLGLQAFQRCRPETRRAARRPDSSAPCTVDGNRLWVASPAKEHTSPTTPIWNQPPRGRAGRRQQRSRREELIEAPGPSGP